MRADVPLDNLEIIAESQDGIRRLKELILSLAFQGKLTERKGSEFNRRLDEKSPLFQSKKGPEKEKLPSVADDEVPYVLPSTWRWVRLGDVTNFGETQRAESISDDTWVLDLEDVERDSSRVLQKVKYKDRASKSDKLVFRSGDVLYGKLRPYLNKVVIADEGGVCTTEILPIRGNSDLLPRYLLYALKRPEFLKYVESKSYGVKMPRLGIRDGRMALLPLAPPAEQTIIADKVVRLFKQCDELEKCQKKLAETKMSLNSSLLGRLVTSRGFQEFSRHWARIHQNFDLLYDTPETVGELKKAILQLAVQGKLVPQDPKDEPASVLLEKIAVERERRIVGNKSRRSELFSPVGPQEALFDVPKSWVWTRLGTVYDVRDGTHESPQFHLKGIPLVTSKNLFGGELDLSNVKYVTLQDHVRFSARSKVQRNDILYAMIGSIGNPVIVDTDIEFSIKNVALFKCFSQKLSDPEYLYYFLRLAESHMRKSSLGGVQSFVSLNYLRSYPFPLPPLEEQKRIKSAIRRYMELCDELEVGLEKANGIKGECSATIVERIMHQCHM